MKKPRPRNAAINVTVTLRLPTTQHRALSESITSTIGELNEKGYRLLQIFKNDITSELWETILIFERIDPWPVEKEETPHINAEALTRANDLKKPSIRDI